MELSGDLSWNAQDPIAGSTLHPDCVRARNWHRKLVQGDGAVDGRRCFHLKRRENQLWRRGKLAVFWDVTNAALVRTVNFGLLGNTSKRASVSSYC
jgi:hypothetical protein